MSGVVDTNLSRGSGSIGAPASGKAVTESSSNPVVDTNPPTGVGTLYLNTSSGNLFCCTDSTADSNHWINVGEGEVSVQPAIPFLGDRAVFGGGWSSSTMDYFSISSLGSASSFGSMDFDTSGLGACSNRTRGLFVGGVSSSNVIQYITVASTGNSTDFGNLTVGRGDGMAGMSNGTRGVAAGGYASGNRNEIDYVTISSTGNATDFGNLTVARYEVKGFANETRGVIGAGAGDSAVIDYITVASTGNATDFGDMSVSRYAYGASCHRTRGLFSNGTPSSYSAATDVIDYITIASTGNATDFGDTNFGRYWTDSASDGTKHVTGGGDNTSDARISTCEHVTIDTIANALTFGGLSSSRRIVSALSGS